jgi:hypothetical protein
MISFFEATLTDLAIHRVGNKSQDEFCILSEESVKVTEEQTPWLMAYFLNPFQKVNERYSFYHPNGNLEMNEAYSAVDAIFTDDDLYDLFQAGSQDLAKLLYDVSNHPKIKGGELCVALFENIQIDGELLPAIGIFKSETKESFMQIKSLSGHGFTLGFTHEAISLNGLDKGCLIFNTNKEAGYKVICFQGKGKDSSFWKDEFLGLQVINNAYHQTNTMIGIVKSFITDKLDEEFEISTADKVDLLNKSVKYLKEKESFDLEEFTNEVLSTESSIQIFKDYKSQYEEEFDHAIPDKFDLSSAAVKKGLPSLKRTIKLDKNFQLQVHGDRNLIEKGFDSDKALNYYKVYFKDEA